MALFGTLRNKVDVWGRRSATRKVRVQWPENMLDYLEREFHLLPKDMVALRCVRRRGSFGGVPASFVRICDEVRASERGVTVRSYRDLDKYPELVLFEGHVFPGGTVYLEKREAGTTEAASPRAGWRSS